MKTTTFQVLLKSGGNPDHDQFVGEGVLAPTLVVDCASVEHCCETARKYITEHNLGAGNWMGGLVTSQKKRIGRISYNGRFWPDSEHEKK